MARWLAALVVTVACAAANVGAHRLAAAVRELGALRHALLISPAAVQRVRCNPEASGARAGGAASSATDQAGGSARPEPALGLACRTVVRWHPVAGSPVDLCDVLPDPAGVEPARRYEIELACVVRLGAAAWRLPAATVRVTR